MFMKYIDQLEELYYKNNVLEDSDLIISSYVQFSNMYQFVGLCDKYGNIIDANSTALIEANLKREDIFGLPFWETHWFNINEEIKNKIKDSCKQASMGNITRFDIICNADNRDPRGYIDMDFIMTPLYNSKNEVVFMVPEGRDISKQKKMELALIEAKQKAENSSKAKTEFLATMTHELRTPLNGIKCITDLIKTENLSDDLRDKIDIIAESSANLSQIINNILDFSAFERDKVVINKSIFNIKNVVESVKNLLMYKANSKGLDIKIKCPNIICCSDKLLYSQVLINLIGNAIKFTNEGFIEIVVISKDNILVTYVKDTGIGIPNDKIDTIFEYFHMLNDIRNSNIVGTGLGLAICKRAVEKLGGNIVVKSIYGAGTIFSFDIVNHQNDNDNIYICENYEIGNNQFTNVYGSLYPLKILVADDNKINRIIMREFFKKLGYNNIDLVNDGLEIIEKVKHTKYDVIFTDIRMPNMNGIDTTKKLKSIYGNSSPLIIAVTANTLEIDIQMYKDIGMFDHIGKPIDISQLKSCIKKVYEYNGLRSKFDN